MSHQQHLIDGGASGRVDQPAAVLDAGEGYPQGLLIRCFHILRGASPKKTKNLPFLFSSSSSYRWSDNAAKDDNSYKTKKVFNSPII